MDILAIVMVALLAGAVLHLYLQLRHYQRIDYSALIQQEDIERQATLRLARMEDLLSRLLSEEQRRREEMASALGEVRSVSFTLRNEMQRFEELSRLHSSPPPLDEQGDRRPQSPSTRQVQPAAELRPEPRRERPVTAPSFPSAVVSRSAALAAANAGSAGDERQLARELGLSSHAVELIEALKKLRSA